MAKTVVWVQGSAIDSALGNPAVIAKKDAIDLERTGGSWAWSRCVVVSGDPNGSSDLSVQVADADSSYDGQSVTLPASVIQGAVLMANEWDAAAISGDANDSNGAPLLPPDDLITLTHLHEPSVVYCLKERYNQDLIYTSTGPILIALNPFKALPGLYDDVIMNEYWLAGENIAKLDLKPHIYQSAHAAFRSMMQGIEMRMQNTQGAAAGQPELSIDQSMLVSGESGAGKTVTTKHIMKYLASLSQRKAEHAKRRRAASPGRSEPKGARRSSSMRASRAMSWKAGALIEERILESNPVLEAFGNARTLRNDNSSRFGKFIELQFKQTGSLIGANIDTYLLEKVRLVHQAEGERNFHIFYEMIAAATEEERKDYMLGDFTIQDFKMTNSSGCYDRRDGADDAELFDELVFSMGTMGFEAQTQEDIFALSVGFLHASNLAFSAPTDESSKVDDSPHLDAVLKLLGIEKEAFNAAMTEYEIDVGNQSYTRQLTVDGAQKALEAFIKGTYGAMFSFIVNTVNKKIDYKPAKGAHKFLGKAASISVLDIFGFESFKVNSFEQLCINYCNEALQQQFNLFIFKSEQAEYKKEGIAWDVIEFPDNKDVIDLIEKKGTGLLSILTDTCRTPRGTDKTYVDLIYKQCDKNDRFPGKALHKGKGQFIINHYAGAVLYDSEGFVEKNKDETPRGASALLESSSKEFVQLLGKIARDDEGDAPAKAAPARAKKRPTVGSQFSSQLADLRNRIDQTAPHYVRCLKPNQSLKPSEFESAMIADQLRYAGVLEAIRVSRVGYSQRYSHSAFFERYRFIALDAVHDADDNHKIAVLVDAISNEIWAALNPGVGPPADIRASAGIQKGETKVFLRQTAFDFMEKFRNERLTTATTKIQSVVRRFLQRCRYLKTLSFVIAGQASARRFLARKYLQESRQKRAATRLQTYVRFSYARKQYASKKCACAWLQRYYRGHIGRKNYKKFHDKMLTQKAMNDKSYKSAVFIQCMYRSRVARQVYQEHLKIGRRASRPQLEGKALAEAIKAAKVAAIARQTAKDRTKEVDALTTRLAGAKNSAEKAKLALEELKMTRAQLTALQTEFEIMKLNAEGAQTRAAKLEEENKQLKEKLKSGTFDGTAEAYGSQMYEEHVDLKQLDERMHGMSARSKKSKADVMYLVQALKILQ